MMIGNLSKTILATSAALLISAGAGAAQTATTYTCAIDNKQEHGLIPEVIFFGHKSGEKKAVVSDPIILHFNDEKPMEARVVRANAQKTVFRWSVRGAKTVNQRQVKLRYEADVNRQTGAIYVAARVTEFSGQLSGRGKCEIKTVKSGS